MKEVVLPSGKFARIRPLLWGDYIHCIALPSHMWVTNMIVRCVTIDGESVTIDEVMNMDFEEIIPLNLVLQQAIEKGMATQKGIS